MKTKIIAENYKRFFGEELSEADMVSKQGQDMSGGPIQQNDPAADEVGSFKPDTASLDKDKDKEGDDTKLSDTGDLKNQIFDLLKEGETPESIIIKFFGKDDKGEDEIKKALEDLKNEGKVQDRVIWSIVATDEEEEKTGVSKDSAEDETDLTPEEEPESPEAATPPAPGGMPPATPPAPGGMPPMAMKNNYADNDSFESDNDEDFKDDEFDDFNDEDEVNLPQKGLPDEEEEEEEDEEEDTNLDDVIEDVEDIKILLKSISPRLRRIREKSESAKKATGVNRYHIKKTVK